MYLKIHCRVEVSKNVQKWRRNGKNRNVLLAPFVLLLLADLYRGLVPLDTANETETKNCRAQFGGKERFGL